MARKYQAACEDQRVMDCTFIDTREACGRLPDTIGIDGIHSTISYSNAIVELMWEAMEDNCASGVNVYRLPAGRPGAEPGPGDMGNKFSRPQK
jgi:hypothetical protein